jgi:molybdopterin molybdotransferase
MIARLSGETFDPPKPVAVRSAFSYRKKEGRREYVRVRLADGAAGVEAQKHPREGAGILTSLTETDGLVELPEAVTRIAPGDQVGFLPYAVLR